MLMPKDGHFECEDSCDFKTCDIFEFMDHCGVEFGWAVKLNKRYSFDLFTFLQLLNDMVEVGDLDAMYDHVQSATLMMVNASEGDLEEFMEESIVESEMGELMTGLERLLKEHD